MTDRLETYRVFRAIIPLSFLQISDLYTVQTFYASLNEKDQMCGLCTFPKSGDKYSLQTYHYESGSYLMVVSCEPVYKQLPLRQ